MAIPQALIDIYTNNPTDDFIVNAIKLTHPLFNQFEYLRLTDFYEEFEFNDGTGVFTYSPSAFKISKPKLELKGDLEFSFTFLNVGFEHQQYLRTISKSRNPIVLEFFMFASSNLEKPVYTHPFKINIYNISFDKEYIVLSGKQSVSFDKVIPKVKYTYDLFPGLKDITG